MQEQIERDAAEYGVHTRAGGWRLGLLVARCVVRKEGQGKGGGGRGLLRNREEVLSTTSPKVSAVEFARRAGTSADRVLRYLNAWEKAAVDGVVPAAIDIAPGQDVALPDNDNTPWSDYYDSMVGKYSTERDSVMRAEAESQGVSPSKAIHIANHPGAMRAAILADPSIADVAESAVQERQARQVSESPRPQAPQVPPRRESAWELMEVLIGAATQMTRGVRIASDVGQLSADATTVVTDHVQRIRAACDLIDSLVSSGGMTDANLEAWLTEGTS